MKILTRLLTALFALILLFPALPISASQPESDLRAAVEEQVDAFIASAVSGKTPSNAVNQMLTHAITGQGRDLTLDTDDAVTTAILRSEMTRHMLIQTSVSLIAHLNMLGGIDVYGRGGFSWYDYGPHYQVSGYRDEAYSSDGYLGRLSGYEIDYNTYRDLPYAVSGYDEALCLVVGGASIRMKLHPTGRTKSTASYQVSFTVHDTFDTDGNSYTPAKDKGYDTSTTDLINLIGSTLGALLFRDFTWTTTELSFSLEVPLDCEHRADSHRFQFTAETGLTPASADGMTLNGVTACESTKDGEVVGYHYRLDDPITLFHDKPWVMEYLVTGNGRLVLGSTSRTISAIPSIVVTTRNFAYLINHKVIRNGDNNYARQDNLGGVYLMKDFKYRAKHVYRYRMENTVHADGTNMITFSIYDETDGVMAYGPAPMTQRYDSYYGECLGESDWFVGKDILITYIGSRAYPVAFENLELTIWPSGQEHMSETRFTATNTAPTCTKPGTAVNTCRLCGYSTAAAGAPAIGHTLGEFVSNGDAACTQDGTKTAVCTVCGEKETAVDEGSRLAHVPVTDPAVGATCAEPGLTEGAHCETCGAVLTAQETIPATGEHAFGDWVTVREASTAQAGAKERICTVCAHREEEEIPRIPETEPPVTEPPETNPPTTEPPETVPPETIPPETAAPETVSPETMPPQTVPPATAAPETEPFTTVPSAAVPETTAPATEIVPETTENPPESEPESTSAPDTEPAPAAAPSGGVWIVAAVVGAAVLGGGAALAAVLLHRRRR